jgi:hypothetical protein
MKIRSLTFIVAVFGGVALAACSSSGTGSSAGGSGVGGETSGNGGAGGSMCADSCASAITDNQDICASSSGKDAFDALQTCASSDPTCMSDCANFVMNGVNDSTCGTCLQGSSACMADFNTCTMN